MRKFNLKTTVLICIITSSLLVSSGFYIISVSGWVDIEDPPGVLGNWHWDFNVSELLIFNVTSIIDDEGDISIYNELLIFNISSIERQILNWDGQDYNCSCVNLTEIGYSYEYEEFNTWGPSEIAVGFNHTGTPSLDEKLIMVQNDPYYDPPLWVDGYTTPYLWFIPKNESNINFEWANSTTLDFYYNIDFYDTGSYNAVTNSLKFTNSSTGCYYNATYFDNGTIEKIYEYEPDIWPQGNITTITERIWDYKNFYVNDSLVDDLEWGVEPGDVLYFGQAHKDPFSENPGIEYKYDVVGFKNTTIDDGPFGPIYVQRVLGNKSIWNNIIESYFLVEINATIGEANELEKVLHHSITVYPLGTNGTDFNNTFGSAIYSPYWDQVTIGENIFHLWNSTNDNLLNITLTSDKVMKSCFLKMPVNGEGQMLYTYFRKNETILTIGSHSLDLDPVGKFNLTVEFTSNADIALYWATLPFTPASVEINDGIFYFDLFCNKSAATLPWKVNTTIEGLLNYYNVTLWTFIDYNSTWIEIPSTFNTSTGELKAQLDHFSNYGVKAIPISVLFDGMYINHTFIMPGLGSGPSSFSYSHSSGDIYNVNWSIWIGDGWWDVNKQTRIISNSGGIVFGDGYHTPAWIFTNVSLYDVIPIVVDEDGDHNFIISGELVYDLPGFGPVKVWILEDLDGFGGIAWYEASTGILLNGTFTYYGGSGSYTFNFVDTNVEFTYYTPSNPSISINNGAAKSSSAIVTLTLSAEGADEMCFRNGTTGTWTNWETYATSKQLYLAGSINNTEYTICVKFRNVEGETSPVCDSIKYLIIPGNLSIIINKGATITPSALVTLTLSADEADEMCFRNGTTGTWTNWETYATSKQLYLAGSINNTEYTICVKFRNVGGETGPVCDSIKYLTIPLNLSMIINNGDASTNSTLVTLSLSAIGADEMCFRNGTTGAWSEWENYSTTKELNLPGSINNTEYTICVKFGNVAGETSPVCDSIKYLIIGEEEPPPGLEIIIIIIVLVSIIGGSAVAVIIFYRVIKGRKG